MAGYVVRGKFGQYELKLKAIQFSGPLLSNVDYISHGAALIGHNFVIGRTKGACILFFPSYWVYWLSENQYRNDLICFSTGDNTLGDIVLLFPWGGGGFGSTISL